MLSLEQSVLSEILAVEDAGTRVDALCQWWNENAPPERAGATHFGIYIEADGACLSIDTQDRTIRLPHQFEESGSSARCGNLILEFRRGEQCGPNDYVSFDLAGNAIESNRIGLGKFRQWCERAVGNLTALPDHRGLYGEESRKTRIPYVE